MNVWMFFYIICENEGKSAELCWMDESILLRAEIIIKLAINIPTSPFIQTTLNVNFYKMVLNKQTKTLWQGIQKNADYIKVTMWNLKKNKKKKQQLISERTVYSFKIDLSFLKLNALFLRQEIWLIIHRPK